MNRRIFTLPSLVFTLILPTQASAQENRATPDEAESNSIRTEDPGDLGETVFLSPFEVDASKDAGYKSTNSTSGTSLNTPVKEIPMSIEIINKDFLDDTGATNFREALQYSAGVVLEEFTANPGESRDGNNTAGVNERASADRSPSSRGGLGGRYSNATNIRGFNVAFQNRDGFRYGGMIANYGIQLGGIIDTANVGRMEVIRGPNSLLYGIGVLSGIVNVIPKRPLPEPAYNVTLTGGNYGFMRGTFDLTGPLVRDVAGGFIGYRLGGAWEQRDSWTDFEHLDKKYTMAQLMFQNERWNAFIEYQYADQQVDGIGDQFVYDNIYASIEPTYVNEWGERRNWTRDYGGAPQSARITGPDTYHSRQESDLLANVDFTPIENLTLSAGVFLTQAEEEVFTNNISTVTNQERGFDVKRGIYPRPFDPGTENPEIWQSFIDEFVDIRASAEDPIPGDPRDMRDFRLVRYWWENRPLDTTTQQLRLRGTYSFDSGDFVKDGRMKHTFLLGYHYIKDEADFVTGVPLISRQYANREENATNDPLIIRSIHDQSAIRYNGEPLAQPGNQARNAEVWYDGYYGLYQGSLLNNNLGLIAGVRHDIYHARDREYDRFDDEAYWGDDWTGGNLSTAPSDDWTRNPLNANIGFMPKREGVSEFLPGPEPDSATTFTFAANYRITSGLTVYGLLSEGLTPNTGARDGNEQGIPSEESNSQEIGLKFDVFERKLSGTVSVYRIVRENAIWQMQSAPAPVYWVGEPDPDNYIPDPATSFDPARIVSGEIPVSYGMNEIYFNQEGIYLGPITQIITDPVTGAKKRVKEYPAGLVSWQSGYRFSQYDKLDEPVLDRNGDAQWQDLAILLREGVCGPGSRLGLLLHQPGGAGGLEPDRLCDTPGDYLWLQCEPSPECQRDLYRRGDRGGLPVDLPAHTELADDLQLRAYRTHPDRALPPGRGHRPGVRPELRHRV